MSSSAIWARCAAAVTGDPVVLGGVELAHPIRCRGPAVRPPGNLQGAAVCGGVVERDPAREHLGRRVPGQVGVVAVKAQRPGARRLPQHVVLGDAGAGPAREAGHSLAEAGVEHHRRDQTVGLPAVADLAGERRIAVALAPVDLVGGGAGLEVAPEQPLEPVPQRIDQAGVDQRVDRDEAVGLERGRPLVRDEVNLSDAGGRRHARSRARRSRPLAMMVRWISLVPSPMAISGASR